MPKSLVDLASSLGSIKNPGCWEKSLPSHTTSVSAGVFCAWWQRWEIKFWIDWTSPCSSWGLGLVSRNFIEGQILSNWLNTGVASVSLRDTSCIQKSAITLYILVNHVILFQNLYSHVKLSGVSHLQYPQIPTPSPTSVILKSTPLTRYYYPVTLILHVSQHMYISINYKYIFHKN